MIRKIFTLTVLTAIMLQTSCNREEYEKNASGFAGLFFSLDITKAAIRQAKADTNFAYTHAIACLLDGKSTDKVGKVTAWIFYKDEEFSFPLNNDYIIKEGAPEEYAVKVGFMNLDEEMLNSNDYTLRIQVLNDKDNTVAAESFPSVDVYKNGPPEIFTNTNEIPEW